MYQMTHRAKQHFLEHSKKTHLWVSGSQMTSMQTHPMSLPSATWMRTTFSSCFYSVALVCEYLNAWLSESAIAAFQGPDFSLATSIVCNSTFFNWQKWGRARKELIGFMNGIDSTPLCARSIAPRRRSPLPGNSAQARPRCLKTGGRMKANFLKGHPDS